MILLLALLATSVVGGTPPTAVAADQTWVVALGDSYTAGNGAGNYYGRSGCYQSYDDYAWKYVAALRASGVSSSAWVAACSSAVTSDVYDQIAKVKAQAPDVPPQAKVVLLTIGGNDFGFSKLVAACLSPSIDDAGGLVAFEVCSHELNKALDAFDEIAYTRVENVLRTIHGQFPQAQVVLLGYPHLTSPHCGYVYDSAFDSVQNDYDQAEQTAIDDVNRDFRTSVFHFISVASTFSGHGPCAAASAQYVRNAYASQPFVSFHPNPAGWQAEADLIFAKHYERNGATSLPPTAVPPAQPAPGRPAGTYVSTCSLGGSVHCTGVLLRSIPIWPGNVTGSLPEQTVVAVRCWSSGSQITDGNGLQDTRWGWVSTASSAGYVSFLYLWGDGFSVPRCDPQVSAAGSATMGGDLVEGNAISFHFPLTNIGYRPFAPRSVVVAIRGPGGEVLDVPCAGGGAVSIALNQRWDCDATLTVPKAGDYTAWLTWQLDDGTWTDGAPADWNQRWSWSFTVAPGPLWAISSWDGTWDATEGGSVNLNYVVANPRTSGSVTIPFIGVHVTAPDGSVSDQRCDGSAGPVVVASGDIYRCSVSLSPLALGDYHVAFEYQRTDGTWYDGHTFDGRAITVVVRPVADYVVTAHALTYDARVGGAVHASYTVTNTGNAGGRILPAFLSTYAKTSDECAGINYTSTDFLHIGVYLDPGQSYVCTMDTTINQPGDILIAPDMFSYGIGQTSDLTATREWFADFPAFGTIHVPPVATVNVTGFSTAPVAGADVQLEVSITNTSTSAVTLTPRFWVDGQRQFVGSDGTLDADGGCDDWPVQTVTIDAGTSVDCTLAPLRLLDAKTESLWAELTVGGLAQPIWQHPTGFTFQVGQAEAIPEQTQSSSDPATPPRAAILSGPGPITNGRGAQFSMAAQSLGEEPAKLTCSLDGLPATPCDASVQYSALPEGAHTFNVVAVAAGGPPSDPVSYRWIVDLTAPAVKPAQLPSNLILSGVATFTLNGSDNQPGLRFNVRERSAGVHRARGAWGYPTALQGLDGINASMVPVAMGTSACFSVQAVDAAANTSPWSSERCVDRPVDDRVLRTSGGWRRARSRAAWNGTVTTTSRRGARIWLPNVSTGAFALVATTCAKCGRVAVFLGARRVATIDLHSTRGRTRQVFKRTLPAANHARVSLVVETQGRLVAVDGLASSAS